MFQEGIVAIGLSNGFLALFDCAKAKTLRAASVCEHAVSALAFKTKQDHVVAVASQSKLYEVQISPAISVQSSSEIGVSGKKTGAHKKQKQQQTVVQLCFSKDDSQLISVDRKGSLTVTAKGSQVWAKPSLHQ